MFAGYNIVYGLAKKGIDNSAHLGGFAGGVVFGFLLALPLDPVVRARVRGRTLGIALLVFEARSPSRYQRSRRVSTTAYGDELALAEGDGGIFPARGKTAGAVLPLRDPAEQTDYAAKLEAGQIAFDTEWIRRLNALVLTPGMATAQARDLLVQALELRHHSYEHLASSLRRHDPQAIAQFEADNREVAAAINRFNAAAKR